MDTTTPPESKKIIWTARIMAALPALLLAFSAGLKFAQPPDVAKGFEHLGWTMSKAFGLGILELACTIVYLVPRTAVLGAVLLTAYLGGAIATCVRVGDAFVMQVVLGVLVWGAIYLRDARLRALLPLKR